MDRKYLDEIRTEELIEETKNRLNKKEPVVFKGTTAEWNALTEEEKSVYSLRCFTDGSGGEIVDNYSTVETKTNKVWIDGKPIYRKVFDGLSINVTPSAWTSTSIVLTDCETLIGVFVPAMLDLNSTSSVTSNVVRTKMNKSTKTILVATMYDSVTLTTMCFEYTKTTD